MSRRVTLIFCSSAGAALQPKTVQPPFSVKQSAWCGVPQPVHRNCSPESGSIGVRQ